MIVPARNQEGAAPGPRHNEEGIRMLPEDECARLARLAEVIEEVTGADFDTAAQLAQDVISKAAHKRTQDSLRAYIEGR
jgi:hypothetical protein